MSPRTSSTGSPLQTPLSLHWYTPRDRFSVVLLFSCFRILEEAAVRGVDSELGLLFGNVESTGGVWVKDVRSVARGSGPILPSLAGVAAAIPAVIDSGDQLRPAGVYLLDRGTRRTVSAAMFTGLEELFSGRTIVLHVQARPHSIPRCVAYTWNPNDQSVKELGLEFPLDHGELVQQLFEPFQAQYASDSRSGRHRELRPQSATEAEYLHNASYNEFGAPALPPLPSPQRTPRKWVGGLIALSVLAAVLGWFGADRRFGISPAERDSSAGEDGRERGANNSAPADDFSLTVKGEGANTQIRWDQRSPAVQAATVGFLDIEEGPQRTRIQLAPKDLRQGSVVYYARTGDITITMELMGPPGGQRASVRFLNPVQPPATRRAVESALGGHTAPPDPGYWQRLPPPSQPLAEAKRTFVSPNVPDPGKRAGVELAPVMETPLPLLEAAATGLSPTVSSAPLPSGAIGLRTRDVIPPSPAAVEQPNLGPTAAGAAHQAGPPSPGPSATPPKVIKRTEITVPASIRWLLKDGKVLSLNLRIDEQGRVNGVSHTASTSIERVLAHAAEQSVRQWRFAPATWNGHPVPAEYTVRVTFSQTQ